jgi:hypothetical protein
MRFLLLFAALASAVSAAPAKEIHRTFPLAPNGRVVVDTYKGEIHVTTWDRDEVDVSVRIEEDWGWFAQPVDRSDVRIDASASQVRLESKSDIMPSFLVGSSPVFRYTIQMPRRASLRIKDYKSDSDISGIGGDLEVETYKGSLRLRDLEGGLRVNTHKGKVRADFLDFAGATSIDTYKGEIELGLPRNSGFDLRNDLSRKARLDSDFRRDGVVNGGGPSLRLKSYKGHFRLIAR